MSAGSSSSSGGPCGACKFLRRKCVRGCVFAPYFDSEQGAPHFAAVHKVFGASNASKLLLRIPAHKRLDAVITICYEARARLRDPVHGCVAHILALQSQVVNLQSELSYLQSYLSALQLPSPPPPLSPPPAVSTPFSLSDLPSGSKPSADLVQSALSDSLQQPWWPPIQPQLGSGSGRSLSEISSRDCGGDLWNFARELFDRHSTLPADPQPVSK